MAIAKVGSAGGSAGAIGYVLRENKEDTKKPEILAGSFGTEAEIKREFEIYNKLNKRVKNQATHISVSFHPDEYIEAAKKVELAEMLLEKLGFQNVPYLVVEHHDKDYEHFHIVAGRIRDDGTTVKEWKIADRAIKATKELEKDFGLKQVEYTKANDRQIKHDEYKQMERTGELSVMAEAKLVIDGVLQSKPKTKDFVEHLQNAGFEVRPNISEASGKMNGFSFKKDEITFKSSAIAKNYSWKNLQKNGLDYEQERDREFLIEIKKQEELSNEITDKRAKEFGIGRFEEKIADDRINSSGGTNEQSISLKSDRTHKESIGSNNISEGRSDESRSDEFGRISQSNQLTERGAFATRGVVEQFGTSDRAKYVTDRRNRRTEFEEYSNGERDDVLEKSAIQSDESIQESSEPDRDQSDDSFSIENQGSQSDISTEVGRSETNSFSGNQIASFQQRTTQDIYDGALPTSTGYKRLSGRNQTIERQESEANEIAQAAKENPNNLGNFGGYQRHHNFSDQTLLEAHIIDDPFSINRLLPEALINKTLLVLQESLKKQQIKVSQEAIDLYESKLKEMAFQPPNQELIVQVGQYNKNQSLENQISVEDKTALEIHAEFLQNNTDSKTKAINNYLETEVKKQIELDYQNYPITDKQSFSIEF